MATQVVGKLGGFRLQDSNLKSQKGGVPMGCLQAEVFEERIDDGFIFSDIGARFARDLNRNHSTEQ